MGFRFNRFGARVPTVVVSPLIKRNTIGRPAGWTPFDHTSIIKAVQVCFGIEAEKSLTARDEAAPDLSCLLTLAKPRTDKPAVKPLKYNTVQTSAINDLHHLLADTLAEWLGVDKPADEEIHRFIHDAYQRHFANINQE